MAIRSETYFMEGVWDWSILDGCFGESKITPTDIDGAIERNGKFLFLETKRPEIEIPRGQSIFYDRLVQAGHSVLYVWGEKNYPQKLRLMTPSFDRTYPQADTQLLRKLVTSWYEWADQQPSPRRFVMQEPKP